MNISKNKTSKMLKTLKKMGVKTKNKNPSVASLFPQNIFQTGIFLFSWFRLFLFSVYLTSFLKKLFSEVLGVLMSICSEIIENTHPTCFLTLPNEIFSLQFLTTYFQKNRTCDFRRTYPAYFFSKQKLNLRETPYKFFYTSYTLITNIDRYNVTVM